MDADAPIYQLKITLLESKPPIWRRLRVRGDITLAQLHDIIQVAMGWTDSHLHVFEVGKTCFGEPSEEDPVPVHDEKDASLAEIIPGESFKFDYEYDFGDTWRHRILVEKIVEPEELKSSEPGSFYAECVGGRRACPPEDVGGVWGYENFLKAIRDPKHPEHEQYVEWIGGEFDPEAFDVEEVNVALSILAEGARRRRQRRNR